MNDKTDTDLEREVGRNESIAHCGGWAVVIGLFTEVFLAIAFRHGETFAENFAPVFADSLVALGVYAEVHFGRKSAEAREEMQRRSDEKVAAANHLAAEANSRAEQAKLETERLRAHLAWRRLDDKQHVGLATKLRNSGLGASVKFCVVMNDQESLNFAQYISMAFVSSGWTVGFSFNSYSHGIMTGIMLPEPQDNWLEEMTVVNGRVRNAFIAAEIPFLNGWPLEPYMQSEDTAMLSWPHAWVYVGPKPAPIL